jgi:hypothetical protein
LVGSAVEHIVLDPGSFVVRIDVIGGKVQDGPVALTFDVPDGDRLDVQLDTIRMFSALCRPRRHEQLARRLLALQAVDAKEKGASLREIADIVLGSGDWPGDGEHRKSRVRRLLESGARMIRDGHRPILAMRGI